MQAFGLFPGQSPQELTRFIAPDPTVFPGEILGRTVAVHVNPAQLTAVQPALPGQRLIPAGVVCAALTSHVGALRAGQLVIAPTRHSLCEQVVMTRDAICALPDDVAPEEALAIAVPGIAVVRAFLDFAQVHAGQTVAVIDDDPVRRTLTPQIARYFGVHHLLTVTTATAATAFRTRQDAFHAIINFTGNAALDQLALGALYYAGILASAATLAPSFGRKVALFVHMGARSQLNEAAAAMPLWSMLTAGMLELPSIQVLPLTTPGVRRAYSAQNPETTVTVLSIHG